MIFDLYLMKFDIEPYYTKVAIFITEEKVIIN